MSLGGVLITAVAVGVFKIAALGVDPFQALMSGLDRLIPIPFGTLYMLVNALLLLFSLIWNRHNIGIATFINLFLLGYVTQFSYDLLRRFIVEPSLPVRLVCLAVGVLILCVGSSLYMTADLGVSTYDSIAITMADRWKWGPFQLIRVGTDLACVALGVLFFLLSGGSWARVPEFAGVGTIVTAFFMGPLIAFFQDRLARPMLSDR